ncbi:MAG: hypothetical protein KIT79_07135 [Deltaproteobacteria bacterium]|nr:hypothetical protein [Deltaproteobacteria bacterium]
MAFKFLRYAGILFFILTVVALVKLFGTDVPSEREHAIVMVALFSLLGMMGFSLSFTENVEDPEYML